MLSPKMAAIILVAAISVFDIIAFALAVVAEQRRSTATVVADPEKNYTYCVYDSDVATGYGVVALLFLLASQAGVMVASKCFCCGRRSLKRGGYRKYALFLFLGCWVTFITAESCLLAGSVENAYHTRYRTLFVDDPPSCQTLRKGVFGAGAAFVFFTALLTKLYYYSFLKANDDTALPAIGLGANR